MIAKRVMRGKAGDFGRLGDYIVRRLHKSDAGQVQLALAERTSVDAADIWQRTADYILDAAGGGERASAVRITNCVSASIEEAITEIVALQARNQRARGDRTYHLVVSFPPGEKPPVEVLHDIEDELCQAIGLGRHQRISAVHTDTEHLHVHIAINQVHPETLACIEPWQDRPKLMRACDRLEIKHGLTRTNHETKAKDAAAEPSQPPRAEAMEIHSGLASLAGWIRSEARPALLKAVEGGRGWQDLHAALREYGLDMRQRGAGLIIVERGTGLRVKASTIDRRLSIKALVDRWGAFTRPDPAVRAEPVKARQSYRRRPMHRGVEELFEDWQLLREDRRTAMAALKKEKKRRDEIGRVWFRNTVQLIENSGATSAMRRGDMLKLRSKARVDIEAEEQWWQTELAKFNEKHPSVPSWLGYLREAASQGNAAALAALRRNISRYRQAVDAVAKGDAGNPVIIAELRPQTLANGNAVYVLRDGGKVIDDGRGVVIERESRIAIALTLAIMAARSPSHEVVIASPQYRQAMIEIAARDKMDLRFADARDEQERMRLATVFEREDAHLAATVFVAGCNAASGERSGSPVHRFWTGNDAGAAAFEGLQPLDDGAQALLLRKGDEILVLPLTAAEASALPAYLPGEAVDVSPERRFERGQQR